MIINSTLKELNYGEIEVVLLSVWHCYQQIWGLYENGTKPTLETSPYPFKRKLYSEFRNVLIGA